MIIYFQMVGELARLVRQLKERDRGQQLGNGGVDVGALWKLYKEIRDL